MNQLKRLLGIVWMLLSPAIIVFLFWQAYDKISHASVAAKANVTLQWVIILIIFLPISIGFAIFGNYSFKGEYDHLPQQSAALED